MAFFMAILRFWRLLMMIRLVLAQDELLPPDFNRTATRRAKFLRAVLTFAAPRFKPEKRGRQLSDRIRKYGPSYIKLGQFLATRPDIIGPAMAADLGHLQDRLPPFGDREMRRSLAREFETPDAVLADIGAPIAAASIAQVHQAHAPDNPDARYAVKILRPGIEETLRGELAIFRKMARLAEFVLPGIRRLRPVAAVDTLALSVMGETDLRREAAALSEIGENTAQDSGFDVPKVIWEASGKRVLTMQWVDGLSAADPDALRAAGHDMRALATKLIRVFLTTALRDGFFHADMHQGNLLVRADGTLVAIDFGITARLDSDSRRYLAEILHGFIFRNYTKVARVHFEAGYVPAHHSQDAFAQALRGVVEPIHDKNADKIAMSRVLNQLFDVTEQFDMETRTELLLLQKTMVTVEGVARSFDPQLNIWEAAEPVVADWLKQQFGPQAILRDLQRLGFDGLATLRRLPDLLAQIETGIAALEKISDAQEQQKSHKPAAWPGWLALTATALAGTALAAHFIKLPL